MTGQTLGRYRIEEKLGEGGMGVVYRAHDTALARDVAIKVLPEVFARDPDRLARFKREAQLLASLNHPNIAAIHGLEEQDGVRYLVLELVPGETLAERVGAGLKLAPTVDKARGEHVRAGFKPAPTPLAVDEALEICRQVAEALEAAHEKGIVHRDLKPANVKLTPEGKVKVLDFGLAKAFEEDASSADLSRSPTISMAATRAGVILGTAAYMSPEQARGKTVDKRADIWAFGCLLYELLTGSKAFGGETVTDTIAAIVKLEPDWNALPEATPAKIRDLLRRCLQKDPTQRLRDIGDARLEMDEALRASPISGLAAVAVAPAALPMPRAIPWKLVAAVGLTAALAASLAVWSILRALRPAPPGMLRLTVTLPAKMPLTVGPGWAALAVSPDGRRLVYVATAGAGTQLVLRALDQFDGTPIVGTESATNPFFSPDSQWIGFGAGGKLKKVAVTGGAPLTLCDAPNMRGGGTWGADGTIVFAPTPISGLSRVSSAGGTPQVLTKLEKGERAHRYPEFLPGGKAVLFTITGGGALETARIDLLSLETGQRRVLVEGGSYARYAATGHLVYARTGGLLMVPFDLKRLQVTGPPIPILEGVTTHTSGAAQFSFSADGSLVYLPGGAREAERTLVWVDRKGGARPLSETRRQYLYPRVSPDGRHVAFSVAGTTTDVWVYEVGRDTMTRLTFEAENWLPIWTPDGKRITYASTKAGPYNLYWKAADGSGAEERLTTTDHPQWPGSWSPDGKFLAFFESHPSTGLDLMVLPMEGDPPRRARPFLQTQFNELAPAFSQDGRWIAYQSNEAGGFQVYVQPFPGPGGKWQVSTDGGMNPNWSRNGRELFYRNGGRIYAVSVQSSPTFSAGKPVLLFEGQYFATGSFPNHDVAPDGQRFLMIKGTEEQALPTQLNFVLNWFDDLRRHSPPK